MTAADHSKRGHHRFNDDDMKWSFQELRVVLRKHGRMISVSTSVVILLAIIYVTFTTRQYTAYARLLIDTPRNPITMLEGGPSPSSSGLAIPEVESSLQVLVSERLALIVFNKLSSDSADNLTDKRSGFEITLSLISSFPSKLIAFISGTPNDFDPQRVRLEKLMNGLSVRRVGSSYVLEIAYTSPDPNQSAKTANLFANSYVQDEVETKAEIWRRASLWLQNRVDELRQKSEEAARAAQDFKAQNGNNADTWPKARELDRTAEAYDALYSAFLKRYTDSVQQQTFPISQARVITEATRPQVPSHPRSLVILALAAILGSSLGTTIAFVSWSMDRAIRSPAQINRYGYRCLTTLPRLPRVISKDPEKVMRTIMRAPRSQFAENLRLVRAEISLLERTRPIRTIGLTSAQASEGKSSVAANLAQLYSTSGKTLLIDADQRNPQITKIIKPDKTDLNTPIFGCRDLDFICPKPHKNEHAAWFETAEFETLISDASAKYEKVFIDLPPAGVVAEARYAIPLLDAIIIITEWEATPAEAFISCVDACNTEPGKVIGVILNKAHPAVMNSGTGSAQTRNYIEENTRPLPFPRVLTGE